MRTINANMCKLIHIINVLLICQRNIYFYLRQLCYLSEAGLLNHFTSSLLITELYMLLF